MAVTARFLADFSSFNQAVDKAEAKLTDFTAGASKVEKALARMTDRFSGRRVLQEATLMEKAVDAIGGTSKLTATELQRVGATASEAIAKLKALGSEVPAGLQRIADEATKAGKASGGFAAQLSSINGLLGGLGVGLSVGAVVGFGKAILNDADALIKMRDRTGISIEGLQRLQVAGDDAGNTIDDMSSAINQFQNRLASGDKSAVSALDKLGVSLEDIQRMAPDQQFMAISEALRNVSDPAQQVAMAMDLFGRTGAQVLPTLKRGFDDVKDAAVGMSTETAERLDQLGDGLQALVRKTKGYTAEAFVSLMDFVASAGNGTIAAAKRDVRETEALILQLQDMAKKATGPKAFSAAPPTQFVASESDMKRAIEESDQALADLQHAHEKAAAAAKKHADELEKFDQNVREVMLTAKGYAAVLDTIDGAVVESVQHYREQGVDLQRLGQMYELTAVQVDALRQAEVDEQATLDRLTRGQDALTRALKNRKRESLEVLEVSSRPIPNVGILAGGENPQLAALKGVDDLNGKIKGAAEAFGVLAQVSGDTFGGLSKGIGIVLSQMNALQQSAQAFGVNLSTANAGLISIGLNLINYLGSKQAAEDRMNDARNALAMQSASTFAEASTLLGSEIAQPYIDAIREAKTLEDVQRRINDLAAAMAKQQALINDATAAVGPSQTQLEDAAKRAREVLDLVTSSGQHGKDGSFTPDYTADQQAKAYYNWQKAMADAGDMAAQAWVDAQDAATKGGQTASKAMDDLKAKRDGLAQSIANEAPEDVMGVIESQIRGQVDALDAEMQAQQDALATQADATAVAVEGAFADVKIVIPIEFDYKVPDFGGINPTPKPLDPIPMASGGAFRVTKPTLFIAGEAGPEDAVFSGANKSLGGGGGVKVGSIVVNMSGADGVDPQALAMNFKEMLRTDATVYEAVAVVSRRAVA